MFCCKIKIVQSFFANKVCVGLYNYILHSHMACDLYVTCGLKRTNTKTDAILIQRWHVLSNVHGKSHNNHLDSTIYTIEI